MQALGSGPGDAPPGEPRQMRSPGLWGRGRVWGKGRGLVEGLCAKGVA